MTGPSSCTTHPEVPTLNGFVALVDVLGFKGVWRRHDASLVIVRMKYIAKQVTERHQEVLSKVGAAHSEKLKLKIAFLSDTVAIGAGYIKPSEGESSQKAEARYALSIVCQLARQICELWLMEKPSMSVRGCIAAGKFIIEENFLIGPAVDEAAESHEIAEGAFVWLLPSAIKTASIRESSVLSFKDRARLVPWNVPLKIGPFQTLVLDPLYRNQADQGDLFRRDNLVASFDESSALSVVIKRQNTAKFLKKCVALSAAEKRRVSESQGPQIFDNVLVPFFEEEQAEFAAIEFDPMALAEEVAWDIY